MEKPYVIIHTHTSIDGKINSVDVPEFKSTSRQYQEIALDPEKQQLNIQGYLNGRTSTDDNMTHYEKPEVNVDAEPVPEGDFIAVADASMYYISIDPSGRLAWKMNEVNYGGVAAPIIEVLTEKASNEYKDFLRRMKISYMIAGVDQLDKELTLHKLATQYGMKRVMIGGGGTINWSFLHDGLVDEVSIVMGPFSNGDFDMPGLFKATEPLSKVKPIAFELIEVKALEESAVWLRYKPK